MQQRLLVVDPTTRRNGFDRLKDPAKAATLGKFKARLAHLQELDDLGATEVWLQVFRRARSPTSAARRRGMTW